MLVRAATLLGTGRLTRKWRRLRRENAQLKRANAISKAALVMIDEHRQRVTP